MAIVHGVIRRVETGVIDLPLGKDEISVVAIRHDCLRADGAEAVTEYSLQRHFRPREL